MFAMFAMTTDSVGIIIPQIVQDIQTEPDRCRNVSVRYDGGHRHGRLSPWSPRGPLRTENDDRRRPDSFRSLLLPLHRWELLPILLRVDGAVRRGNWHLQDRRARADRRYLPLDRGTHLDHEHRGGFFGVRLDHRARASGPTAEAQRSVAVAVRDRGKYVRAADSDGAARAIPHQGRGSGGHESAGGQDGVEEPFRSAVFARSVSLCRRGVRHLRVDAHAV